MNIDNIKSRLLVKYPFFGSVVAKTKFISEPEIKTAATDGKNIYYNPSFVESVTDEQQTFIFAHEVCHIAFNHIFRSEGKDKRIWNIATDSVINAFLMQDGLPIVEGGVDKPEAINYDAEEMYKKLLEEEKNKQSDDSNENTSSQDDLRDQDGENNDVGHDTHSMWDEAIKKKEEKNGSGQTNLNEEEEEIKKITDLGEKDAFKQNNMERKKQLEELRKAIASQSHGYGNDTKSRLRSVNDIGSSKPLIDWRRLLKEAVKYDVDWSYQYAAIEEGILTPNLEEQPKPETEIVLDTSGSIDEILLKNFLRECKNILKTSKVKVGCFDTKFYGFHEIKNEEDIEKMQFEGGGGTDFDVAVDAFSRRVENKIIFTDGESSMPDMPIDAIWIVFGERKINPKGGKVIYIDNNKLEELSNYYIKEKEKGKSI